MPWNLDLHPGCPVFQADAAHRNPEVPGRGLSHVGRVSSFPTMEYHENTQPPHRENDGLHRKLPSPKNIVGETGLKKNDNDLTVVPARINKHF